MSKTLEDRQTEGETATNAPPRLDAVLKMVKLELVSARVDGQEGSRGFNPYDDRLGHASRDPWSRRRRA
ncbi:MAG TPA: hypothetical protein VII17_00230 [Steroidobacteraceae bacterium]